MGACQDFSALYLNLLNGVLAVCGLAIVIYSAVAADDLTNFDQIVSNSALGAAIGSGVLLMLISAIGLCGVMRRNKCLLLVYVLMATFMTLVVFGAGIGLLAFSGVLDEVQNERVLFGVETVQSEIRDFQLAVFQVCCANPFDSVNDVLICSDELVDGCAESSGRFDDFVNEMPSEVCEVLAEVELNGAPIVGDPTEVPGACGGGQAVVFVGELSQFLEDNIKPIGIANLVLAIMMLMDVIASCVLLWSNKDQFEGKKAAPPAEEPKQPEYADVEATNVVHGGNAMKY